MLWQRPSLSAAVAFACISLACTANSVEDTRNDTPPALSTSAGRAFEPVIKQRSTLVHANVDHPIAFSRPTAIPIEQPTADSTPRFLEPAENTKLVFSESFRPPANVPVTCSADARVSLSCPPDAPTPSLCTSQRALPIGCMTQVVRGAFYPAHTYPACCR